MAEGVGAEVDEEGAPEVVAEDLSGSPALLWASADWSFLARVSEVERLGEGVAAVVSWTDACASDMVTS